VVRFLFVLGRPMEDNDLAGEGFADQVADPTQDVSGSAAHVVSDTIRDLNRYYDLNPAQR
jgi:hypothetical protein